MKKAMKAIRKTLSLLLVVLMAFAMFTPQVFAASKAPTPVATEVTTDSISISWNDTGAMYYVVRYKADGGYYKNSNQIEGTSYTINNCEEDTTYSIYVKAYTSRTKSITSSTIKVTTKSLADVYKAQVDDLQAQLDAANARISELEAENANLKSQNTSLEENLATVNDENATLKEKLDAAEAALAEIEPKYAAALERIEELMGLLGEEPDDPEEPIVTGTPTALRIETTSDTTVYTHQLLFSSRGELAFPEGYNAYLVMDDGSEVQLPNGTLIDINPWCAPAEEGPFEAVFTYTTEDGQSFSDTVALNAVHAEPVFNVDAASRAAGLRGNVNGQSLKHIIFTDAVEPADEDCASKAYIGQLEAHAVVAYRLNGQEDTLYITSGIPGVKPIHPGTGGTINSGFVDDVDCRMLDTSRCTTVDLFWANGGGFQHGVKSINFSGCDFSNVESLSVAFNTYTSLQYLDLSNCDFSNVTSLSHMCYNTPNLIKIDMSGTKWGEGKVTNLEYAFGGSGLQEIDLGGLETSAVTTVQGMFLNDKNLQYVDLSGCDFTNVESAAYMFQDCHSITRIDFSASGMPNLKDSMRQMFDCCYVLRDVDLSGLNFSQVSNVFRVLYNCKALRTTLNIDATLFDKSYGYTFADMAIDDNAEVIVNCTQASKEILEDHMIWATSAQYTQHVIYNITD